MWLVLMLFWICLQCTFWLIPLLPLKQPEFQTFLVPLASLFSPVHAYVSLLLRSAPWGQRSPLFAWKTGRDLIRQKTQEKDTSKAWKLFKVKGTHAASFCSLVSKFLADPRTPRRHSSSWTARCPESGPPSETPRARRGFPHTSVSILPGSETHTKRSYLTLSIHLTLSSPLPMSISVFSMSVSPLLPITLLFHFSVYIFCWLRKKFFL